MRPIEVILHLWDLEHPLAIRLVDSIDIDGTHAVAREAGELAEMFNIHLAVDALLSARGLDRVPRVKVPVEFVSSEPKMPGHSVGAAFVPHRFAGPNLHFFFWRTSGSETAFQKATKGTHCGQDLASGKIARFWSVVCRCELREGSRSVQMAIRLANVQLG